MPTTLDQLAEKIAPTRATTNYFDPAAGQSVMSRYANAGRRVADSGLAADATSRLLQSRENRLATRQRQMHIDEDEQDFREKQDFKIQRGNFLKQIADIDPEAEDFDQQISQLHTTLPPAAMKDDAVHDLLAAKRATANDLRNERQATARRDEEQQNRVALLKERHAADPRLTALTADERNQFYDANGEFDAVGAGQLAYQKTRQDKVKDQLDVAGTKRQWKIEDAKDTDLDDAQKRLKTLAKEHAEGDDAAFPSQVSTIRQAVVAKNPSKETKDIEDLVKKDPAYDAARRYDSSKFTHELESARNMSLEKYLAAGGAGLSDDAKAKRETVWQAAHVGQEAAALKTVTAGDKVRGYTFKGGDPGDKSNWEKE